MIPGENVLVKFDKADIFDFQTGYIIECTLVSSPQGPGDHFWFRCGGVEFSVNPYYQHFIGVESGLVTEDPF